MGKAPFAICIENDARWGGTGVIICKNRETFDKEAAIRKLNVSLKDDIYKKSREWPYKNVPRRVIAEKYMSDSGISNCKVQSSQEELKDYKFFCFDGVVRALFIATERNTGDVKFDFFDDNFNHLDLVQTHPMSGKHIEKPKNFELMKELASKLSIGLPNIRVDLYESGGKVYFGELTFFHHGGLVNFHPEKWDYEFGSWITLPEKETKQ